MSPAADRQSASALAPAAAEQWTDRQTKDVGTELTEARERRNLSLTELESVTKISVAALQAIERNDFKKLPQGIYVRGFLRAYAREVGCNPEDIIGRYRAQVHEAAPEGMEQIARATRLHSADIDEMDRRSARASLIAMAAPVLLGIALYWWVAPDRRARPQVDMPAVTTNAALSAPAPSPAANVTTPGDVGTSGSSEDPKPVTQGSDPLQVDIQARGQCWISGTADGQRVIYRLLNEGERVPIGARENVVLRVGDAASLDLKINGLPARRLGGAGEAVTLHLTPQNFRDFVNR